MSDETHATCGTPISYVYAGGEQQMEWITSVRLKALLALLEASEKLDVLIGDELDRHYFEHIADGLSAWRKAIEEAR